jgi:DNA-binding Lrp family transcriptional regulator
LSWDGLNIRNKETISEIDVKILKALLEDGRKSFRDIARQNNISEDVTYRHFRKMERQGIIVGATTQENHPEVGYPVVAEVYTKASITNGVRANVADYVRQTEGVRMIRFNATNRSFSIVVQMRNRKELTDFQRRIEQLLLPEAVLTDYWTGLTIEVPENLSFGRFKEHIPQKVPEYVYHKKMQLDPIDLKILDKLRENGRIPFVEIQKEVGVSIDTIARKYQMLRNNGVIKIVIQICAKKLGYTGALYARIKLRSRSQKELALQQLIQIPDVHAVVELSGEYNFRVYALIRDFDHLIATQEKIADIPSFMEADVVLGRGLIDSFPGPRHWITNWR